jgi:hypothetical protein
MRRQIGVLSPLAAVAALALGTSATEGWAAETEDQTLEQAKIAIEFNATDDDMGVQAVLGGASWEVIDIVSPDGRKVFHVDRGSLKELGINELFFESEEPSFDDLPREQFLALFPEGEYEFLGRTTDGDELEGNAKLTHNLPDAVVIVSPADGTADPDDTVVEWDPVTGPAGVEIAGYQVTVEREDPVRVFSVDLPATSTSVTVPAGFLEPGTEYTLEVLAIETGGNQTVTVGFFETE